MGHIPTATPIEPSVSSRVADLGLVPASGESVHAKEVTLHGRSNPVYDTHFCLELGVIISGRVRRAWRSWQTELDIGDAWYCGLWEPHGSQVVEAPCRQLVVTMLPEALLTRGPLALGQHDWLTPFMVPPERRPQTRDHNRAEVLALVHEIAAGPRLRRKGRALWTKLMVLELLLALQREWTPPAQAICPSSGPYTAIGSAVMMCFRSRGMARTNQVAAEVGMGASTFHRAFHRTMGMTFARFSLAYRLGQAASDMRRTDQPLKTIAFAWGFTDSSHLYRHFVRHYGCSPATYRARHRARERPGNGA